MLFSNFRFVGFAIVAVALAFAATDAKSTSMKDGIELVQNWKPAQTDGSEKVHMITFVGDGKKYQIKGEKYANGKTSNAHCDATSVKRRLVLKNSCSVSSKEHDQIFTVSCTSNKKKNFARVLFKSTGEIEVNTHGKIWAGFTSDEEGQKLRSTELSMQALIAKGDDVGVIFSCISNKRGK
ncbi:uncharacterized protein FA14DRAFT_172542 [Meira miltonrushii]|uniref:Uncharacterized protein n=1 Tax=Meira miltonrushii TaxID=1280837 RepID=A0A316VEK0_9BASI|nr:uncharacterized protein FA14DRAFT_172542 [Meira miltonrushii]PWN35950.1 hypothetical protein FA14DRAFT_172542 [Meira miltonrushii]